MSFIGSNLSRELAEANTGFAIPSLMTKILTLGPYATRHKVNASVCVYLWRPQNGYRGLAGPGQSSRSSTEA